MRPSWLSSVLCASLLSLATAPPASACINATLAETNRVVKRLKAAEAALEDDKFAEVKRLLGREFGDAIDIALVFRARRILALARSRTPNASLAERVEALREMLIVTLGPDPNAPHTDWDPRTQADMAELLSRTPDGKEPALRALRNLFERDLLGSPHALAALARLEREAQRPAEATAAAERCRAASKHPTICQN